jgi:hypothetical protein
LLMVHLAHAGFRRTWSRNMTIERVRSLAQSFGHASIPLVSLADASGFQVQTKSSGHVPKLPI